MASDAPPTVIRHRFDGEYDFDNMLLAKDFNDREELQLVRDKLELNNKDVISASHPKTGSTWMNEIIYQIVHQNSLLNTDEIPFEEKLIFLECHDPPGTNTVEELNAKPSPRLFKTHLGARYFLRNLNKGAEGPRIVLTARNPKDTLVSFYHFYRMDPSLGSFPGTFSDFYELFRQKHLLYEDFFDFYAGWLELGDHPNVLLVKYEDVHKDTYGMIRKIAEHIGHALSDETLEKVVQKTSFKHMESDKFKKSNSWGFDQNVGKFFRKGKVGDWKNHFTKEESDQVDKMCNERLKPLGLEFEFELS